LRQGQLNEQFLNINTLFFHLNYLQNMATWKAYKISDAVNEIDEEKFVLPVILRGN